MSTERGYFYVNRKQQSACRRYIEELFNHKNLAVVEELNSPDFVYHNASQTMQGLEPYKQFLSMSFSAFPDVHLTLEDVIAEGDRVVTRQTYRGTHQGTLMGIPPTGKQVTLTGMAITRIASGKVIEQWANSDDLGLLQQLGVVPRPEEMR